MLEKFHHGEEEVKTVNQIRKKRITSREFRLNANIGYFNMGDIILDLGSEVNVLPRASSASREKPKM